MSIHSLIARQTESGTYQSVYCHWDGHPDNQGPILTQHYATDQAVAALMRLAGRELAAACPELFEEWAWARG